MSLPTRDECRAMLEEHADGSRIPGHWEISGYPYSDEQALKVAEFCLITGQPLSAIATIDGLLNLARRVAELEERART